MVTSTGELSPPSPAHTPPADTSLQAKPRARLPPLGNYSSSCSRGIWRRRVSQAARAPHGTPAGTEFGRSRTRKSRAGRGQLRGAGRGRGCRDLLIAGVTGPPGPRCGACAHAPCAGSRSERRSPAACAPVRGERRGRWRRSACQPGVRVRRCWASGGSAVGGGGPDFWGWTARSSGCQGRAQVSLRNWCLDGEPTCDPHGPGWETFVPAARPPRSPTPGADSGLLAGFPRPRSRSPQPPARRVRSARTPLAALEVPC